MYFDEDFIKRCLGNDPKAQGELYQHFAPKMFGICLRFTRNQMEAEDILQEGFIKVFRYLKDYRSEGSLEGWIRKTIVNTAINFYKKKINFLQYKTFQKSHKTYLLLPMYHHIFLNISYSLYRSRYQLSDL